MSRLLLVGFLLTISVHPAAEAADVPTSRSLPPAVVDFLSRRANCVDLISRQQKDPEGAAEYNKTFFTLNCDKLSDEQQALRHQYAQQFDVVAALDQVWIKVVKRVPVARTAAGDSTLTVP